MLISKKTRKKLTVSALFAAPVTMTAVGASVVSADTVHTPDETQNTVSTNSTTSSANSSAASSATSSATSASATEYQTVVVQPDSAMTNYLKQAAANGMKGEMVATITDGLHNNGDDTSDSIVTINDGGSVTVTLADVNTLAGTVTTTFSNGMVLTSTITNGKMSTQVTTEPTSGSASSATSSAASSDTSSDTSSSGNDSFSDAVSVHSSDASSAASSTASAAYEATTDVSTTRKPVSSDKYASYEAITDVSTASEAVPSASRNASYAPSKSPAFPDASGSLTSGTKVTAFTLYKNDSEYVKNHDGNNEYAKFSTDQSIDLFVYYWAKLKAAATDAGLSDSQYFKLLDAASQPGGDVYNKLVNDEDLTDDQKAELVTDAYQLARQIADKDSNYTLSDVNTTNNTPNGGDDGGNDYSKDDGNGDPSDTYGDDGNGDPSDVNNGDDSNNSAKTLPQAGEEDTSSMSVAGMAMAGAVSLAGMIGSIRKRHELRNEDD